MKTLLQQPVRSGQIFPSPRENETMYETPPCFCWREEEGARIYRVEVKNAAGIVWSGETEKTFIVPERAIEPGEYRWNLYAAGGERGWVRFFIADNAVRFARPDAKTLLSAVPDERPRHLFFQSDAAEIVRTHPEAIATLQRNVALALEDGLPEPPRYHEDETALPYREYFGRHRDYCDRDLVACALAHVLLGDERAAAHAKSLFLALCDWNSEGPCSLEGPWGAG